MAADDDEPTSFSNLGDAIVRTGDPNAPAVGNRARRLRRRRLIPGRPSRREAVLLSVETA